VGGMGVGVFVGVGGMGVGVFVGVGGTGVFVGVFVAVGSGEIWASATVGPSLNIGITDASSATPITR